MFGGVAAGQEVQQDVHGGLLTHDGLVRPGEHLEEGKQASEKTSITQWQLFCYTYICFSFQLHDISASKVKHLFVSCSQITKDDEFVDKVAEYKRMPLDANIQMTKTI